MTGPLLYLTSRSAWNRLRARVRRLREPRYLLGLLAGGLYLYAVFFRRRLGSGRAAGGLLALVGQNHDVFVLVGAVVLLVVITIVWLWPGRRKVGLAFSRADVQLLFTAPIDRRALIRYRLLRSQIGVLIGALIMTLLSRPASLASGGMFLAGLATVMTTINLHVAGVSLYLQPRAERATWWRQWPRLALVASCGLLFASAVRYWSAPLAGDVATRFGGLVTALSDGAAGMLLWPFEALVSLPFSVSAADLARHLPVAAGILALNYLWVTRSGVAFEEAAAEAAAKRTTALSGPTPSVRWSTVGRQVPFRLAAVGRPEVAVMWKNLLMLGRYVSVRLIVRVSLLLLIVGAVASRSGRGEGVIVTLGALGVVVAVFATLLGPQLVRTDLRQDLVYLETLKLWPVRGAELVRGEVLAPTLVLSGVVWFAVLAATVLGQDWWSGGVGWIYGGPWAWAFAVMLIAPGVIVVQVLAQNALAVAFPAWARIGGNRSRGIGVMGQRMLMMVGMLAVVALAILPAAVVGALVVGAVFALTGLVPVIVFAIPATAALVVESFVVTEALGALLERTDVTALDAAE